MEIRQHWKKTPEEEIKRTIPDKFGYWFAENLPEFFYQGVTIRQIQEAMPKKLFEEYCKHNAILYCDESGVVCDLPKKGVINEK